jgi:hypothetical protein
MEGVIKRLTILKALNKFAQLFIPAAASIKSKLWKPEFKEI